MRTVNDVSRVCLVFSKSFHLTVDPDGFLSNGSISSFPKFACIHLGGHHWDEHAKLLYEFLHFFQDPKNRRKCVDHKARQGIGLAVTGNAHDALCLIPLHLTIYWVTKSVVE